jgi:NtrC-family two-component system sensor histidine kinase KinB
VNTEQTLDQRTGTAPPIPLSFFLRGPTQLPVPIPADEPAKTALQKTINGLSDPLFILGPLGQVDSCNHAAEHFSEKWEFHNHLPQSLIAIIRQTFRTGEDFVAQDFSAALHLQMDQEESFYLPKVVLQREPARGITGAVLVLQDVTALHTQAQQQATLVSTASHEIKTPLTSVRAGIYLLLEENFGKLNPKQAELVKDARENIERVLLLISQLLEVDSLENGAEPLDLQTVDLLDLIENAKREARDFLRFKNLQLTVEVSPRLPPLRVDPRRINLALRNLLNNAIKYSPAGGEIVLRASRARQGNIRLAVKDNGPGIREEYQGRIFEKFYRVPGQPKSGTGLGLAIARQNVLAHEGEIGCRSEVGHGSEFYLILPAAVPEGDPAEAPLAAKQVNHCK